MPLKRFLNPITQPGNEALTLDEAKAQLRITHDALDYEISQLIPVAREAFEQAHDHSVMPRDWELTLNCFPEKIFLKMPPIISVTSIKYTDVAGVEQTVDQGDYSLVTGSPLTAWVALVVGKSWPSTYSADNAVRVRYKAGYADANAVPHIVKQWMKRVLTDAHANAGDDGNGMKNPGPDYYTSALDGRTKI